MDRTYNPRPADLGVWMTVAPIERATPLVCQTQLPGATWTWTVDGAPYEGPTYGTYAEGDSVFPGYLRAGETWACHAQLGMLSGRADRLIAALDVDALDPLVAPTVTVEDGALRYTGALLGEAGVSVRFGFDGWSEREATSDAVQAADTEGDLRWGVTAGMSFDGSAWTLPVTAPSSARVIHARFTSGELLDDNDGWEYAWDYHFPSVGPFLTWSDEAQPADGVVVNWESGQPGLGVVEYGPDEENVAYAVGTAVDTLHHVPLTGLSPGTTWIYRVRDALGRTSDWSQFATAGREDDTFTFLVASDMQDNGEPEARWAEVAGEMRTRFGDARFVIAPGDLASDNYPGDWWLFFDGGRELFSSIPIVPSVGNHDTPTVVSDPDSSIYRRWFALPTAMGDEDQYRLDYGRVRVFAMNTEVMSELEVGGTQYGWMEEELAALGDGADRQADWVITHGHHPVYNIGARFGDEGPHFREITALFDGAVDLDIRGHEHIYQRFLPTRYVREAAEHYGLGADEGVAYLVTPAAGFHAIQVEVVVDGEEGDDQLPLLAYPTLAEGQDTVPGEHGFLVGTVTPDVLTVDFYGMGDSDVPTEGVSLDTLRIER